MTISDKHSLGQASEVNEKLVLEVSGSKEEPKWMLDIRLKALEIFRNSSVPGLVPAKFRDKFRFNEMAYYARATEGLADTWDDVPKSIRRTLEGIGIREAEQKYLAGLTVQVENAAVYQSIQHNLEKKGVIFTDLDTAVRQHPQLVKRHFSKIMPPESNIFAALNTALWSGGVFLYVPVGVEVGIPLQSYFRINRPSLGQLEHTVIMLEEGAKAHYIEGCSAPVYSKTDLHAGVVEAFVGKNATLKFTTIQNWSDNVLNISNKRAIAMEGAFVDWVDANMGALLNMKYPTVILSGRGARAQSLSLIFSKAGQVHDVGARMIHLAPQTSSTITSKTVAKGGGEAVARGLVRVIKGAVGVRARSRCDALLLGEAAKSTTVPVLDVAQPDADVGHEATVSRLGDDQLFYLESRGLTEEEATLTVVNGFVADFIKTLPMEYAMEMNRLIELEMKGAQG